MFFQRKYPIIEACSASEKHKVKDWSTSFDEVYLLTHPYYMLHGKEYFFKNYHDVLGASISAVKKRGRRTIGILTLEGDEKMEFSENNPVQKYVHETLERMRQVFAGNLHVRIQTLGCYEEGLHSLPLELTRNVLVSARGIWGNRCALTSLEDFVHVHQLREDRAFLVTSESRMNPQDSFPISERGGFSIAELRTIGKLRENHPKKVSSYISSLVAPQENVLGSFF